MTIPMWMLLGFATWTLLLLMATVGVYRWVRILFSNVPIASFEAISSKARIGTGAGQEHTPTVWKICRSLASSCL